MERSVHLSLVNEIYTPLSEISIELERRRKDKKLIKSVEDFLGEYLLPQFKDEQRAALSRTIISPNKEFQYFLDLAKDLNLRPLGLEYHDKFVAKNPDKYHLAKLYFTQKREDNAPILTSLKLVEFNESEGDNFKDIKTIKDEPIIDFHHNLLFSEHPEMINNIADISSWFQVTRSLSQFYYIYFLSLFICHGVLFENFLLREKGEFDFFLEKVYPSFQELVKIFGVKPLIYPLLPIENEKDRQWMAYEERLKKAVEEKLNNAIID